ncbi:MULTISPECIES: NAD(P)H-dependent oxidoreductase [unclassified Carboxylicivirga]|uniref:NAD(P)H-dependent oxidoreductase n=1 Tax=Carboxylicivirga TaxID=1628153 RepID=UPI003D33A478
MQMNIIDTLNWRYATKHFDTNKKLSEEQLNFILEATNLAPSSYGLQPFSLVVIESDELRQKLKKAAWEQPQITDASHLILFTVNTNLSVEEVDRFIDRIAKVRQVPVEALGEYEAMMKGSIKRMSPEEAGLWAAKQAYIALGQLMVACASEGIDTCPMEGFDKQAFDELLDLPSKGLRSVVLAAVGFRSVDDKYQHLPKVRKSLDELVIKL